MTSISNTKIPARTKMFFAFASKAISFIILFLLCKNGILASLKTFNVSSAIFTSLFNSLTIIYITSLIFLFISNPYDGVSPNLYNGTRGFFKKGYKYKYGYIFLRHRKSRKKGVFSVGCWPLGVILIKGDLNLTPEEIEAVIWHEIYHTQYCNNTIRFFVLFLLKDILIPVGSVGFFLWWAIFWQMGYFSEFFADRYAKIKSSSNQPHDILLSAIKKLSIKNEKIHKDNGKPHKKDDRFYEILEYIPLLNIILSTHPCYAFRKYFA